MKTQLVLLFALICGYSFTQTAIISHKSHSGTSSDFAYADPGNYGLPGITYYKLFRVNDTVIAEETDQPKQGMILIINNVWLQDSLRDSTKVLRLASYQLDAIIGKDTSSEIVQLHYKETPQHRLKQMEKAKPKQRTKKAPKSHNRKSSVLYFGLILGASLASGMLRKKFLRA